ncbi:hypothetical protein [Phreatobacter sp.]|uniref:hypothetical protein n=1 Tax=Phreatobacter sp. TaxID=1966341 RepID=UPI0025E5F37A|nr:hypothetical protein [Phreatobacter sp.]
MRIFGWALLWAVIGLVGGFVAAVIIGAMLFDFFKVSQFEGAAAMGLFFVIAPIVACITALVAGTSAAFVTHRRQRQRADGQAAPSQPWGRGPRAILGAAIGLAGGYGAALLGLLAYLRLSGSEYFSSEALAQVAALAPFMGAAAGCGLGLWIALRDRGPAPGAISG